jgi:hypothetical protein
MQQQEEAESALQDEEVALAGDHSSKDVSDAGEG